MNGTPKLKFFTNPGTDFFNHSLKAFIKDNNLGKCFNGEKMIEITLNSRKYRELIENKIIELFKITEGNKFKYFL